MQKFLWCAVFQITAPQRCITTEKELVSPKSCQVTSKDAKKKKPNTTVQVRKGQISKSCLYYLFYSESPPKYLCNNVQ